MLPIITDEFYTIFVLLFNNICCHFYIIEITLTILVFDIYTVSVIDLLSDFLKHRPHEPLRFQNKCCSVLKDVVQ